MSTTPPQTLREFLEAAEATGWDRDKTEYVLAHVMEIERSYTEIISRLTSPACAGVLR